jgi:hypothetical protein
VGEGSEAVARDERSETRGRGGLVEQLIPDFAEFIIGPAKGRTQWLNPGYTTDSDSTCGRLVECVDDTVDNLLDEG